MERVDAIVIGAGVVGLAAARALALRGNEVFVLEAEARFGSVTSSRNSEVIHAGLHYPAGSLKAELCVEGRDRLYAYCAARGVAHRRLGKLIVAQDAAGRAGLEAIELAAGSAGVTDLRRLGGRELRRLEPALKADEALLSPSTGIVDSHGFMLALLAEAEAGGATLVCRTRVTRAEPWAAGWRVWIEGEPEPVLGARRLVNAAGLGAQALARRTEGLAADHVPDLALARGAYFTYRGAPPFSRLVYPVPVPGGLGIHLTFDLAGQARFGPDVEWIETIDHTVNPRSRGAFAAAVRRFWPAVEAERLEPGYAGIRPKLAGPGAPPADFMLCGPAQHGLAGLVNLFGIESPGLTASLALAERVAAALD